MRAFIDIDSLVRPVYGHHKQGASYGHTKIAGKQVLRNGLSPLVTTISTDTAPPLVTGIRLRAGKTNSGKGAARMVAQAITTARAAGVSGLIIVRGDSAYGSRAVMRTCRRYGAVFSLVLTRNAAVQRAIDAICEDAWTPVQYPGAVRDSDTGVWISHAEVAETAYTLSASATAEAVTARLIVRRVKDANQPDGLFPIWRYHPFFTNSTGVGQGRICDFEGNCLTDTARVSRPCLRELDRLAFPSGRSVPFPRADSLRCLGVCPSGRVCPTGRRSE